MQIINKGIKELVEEANVVAKNISVVDAKNFLIDDKLSNPLLQDSENIYLQYFFLVLA